MASDDVIHRILTSYRCGTKERRSVRSNTSYIRELCFSLFLPKMYWGTGIFMFSVKLDIHECCARCQNRSSVPKSDDNWCGRKFGISNLSSNPSAPFRHLGRKC
ncbi:hypothetical protein AVEN_221529-1 [Araneus ventricosus]|uniref:Uncharacterized protein n=1 Tax=Araneus ventricosus TaxID=182803 RepID=A0A4Y2PC97_ARAVE|nr:hypothetical protein AVEN_221529-1 [Araneus ventricosus]